MFNERQRMAFTSMLGMIPVAGVPLAGAYMLGRGINAIRQYIQSRQDPDVASSNYIGRGDEVGAQQPQQAQPQAAPASAPSYGAYQAPVNGAYNTGRAAFSPSFQQRAMPGSAIGPGAFSTTGSGSPSAIGHQAAMGGPISSAAANNYASILKRNIQ